MPPEFVRIPPLPLEEWNDEATARFPAHLRRPAVFTGPNALPMPNVLGLFANSFAMGNAWLDFTSAIEADATLDRRCQELIILRVAWRTRAAYEWSNHVRSGQTAGITMDEIHAVTRDPDDAAWTPLERAILEAVDQVYDRAYIGDETWTALARELDAEQLLEVLFFAGAYICFAAICNSAGLEPDAATIPADLPPLPPLDA